MIRLTDDIPDRNLTPTLLLLPWTPHRRWFPLLFRSFGWVVTAQTYLALPTDRFSLGHCDFTFLLDRFVDSRPPLTVDLVGWLFVVIWTFIVWTPTPLPCDWTPCPWCQDRTVWTGCLDPLAPHLALPPPPHCLTPPLPCLAPCLPSPLPTLPPWIWLDSCPLHSLDSLDLVTPFLTCPIPPPLLFQLEHEWYAWAMVGRQMQEWAVTGVTGDGDRWQWWWVMMTGDVCAQACPGDIRWFSEWWCQVSDRWHCVWYWPSGWWVTWTQLALWSILAQVVHAGWTQLLL